MSAENIKKLLREKVLMEMHERNISQAMLAKLVGSDRRVINVQLNSESTSIEKLIQFAEALSINFELKFKE